MATTHRFIWNVAPSTIPFRSPPARASTLSISKEPYFDCDNEVLSPQGFSKQLAVAHCWELRFLNAFIS